MSNNNNMQISREFEHVHKNKAKVESLDYYFKNNFVDANNVHNIEFLNQSTIEEDKSWIDWDCVTEIHETTEWGRKYKSKKKLSQGSQYPPTRCYKCSRPYSRQINNTKKFLPFSNYIRVPLEKGDCGMCL
tara:strand:+ start:297 stop:689 length:393 start_codon:yes stop_codon:yes gene_type:complete